jgi:serine phosphatase RsbU (regulator of sigma subunit)/type II secretory pathway predicted ATPase ExeA
MIGMDATLEAPTIARYHREAVEQIIQCVEERVYCAVLGPRLSGKTMLLRYIERNLATLLGWTCIYIDLMQIRATTQQAFFADLINLTARRLLELSGHNFPVPDEHEASSAVFRAFLLDSLEVLGFDVVLLIDPLEALPTDLVQALLTSLRAAYMDQQTMENQIAVVVSGALSLATLTVGESSPFRGIARRVFVGDISDHDSHKLILEFLLEGGINATNPAVDKLRMATSGDIYLIRKISQRSLEMVRSRTVDRLRSRDVNTVINHFLRDEVFHYAPLLEAIRLIEEDPDLLACVLLLLERESVPRSALTLPLSPDLDPLYLTGVVERVQGDHYRLQNMIYRQFLTRHFTPWRVGNVLAMAGRWDSAIDYLEVGIQQGSLHSNLDVLPATINSMYASHDLTQAVHFLRRGLTAAFGVSDALIWYCPPQEKSLRLIGSGEANAHDTAWSAGKMPISADRLEARAFRSQSPLRGQENAGRVVRAIPLSIPGDKTIGVATIYDEVVGNSFNFQRERSLQMVGFLNQAARALQAVSLRRQELVLAGRVQTSLLPDRLPEVSGWQITATWRPARETSGDFYDVIQLPDNRVGIVIADVVDKGMGAALMMALSRTLLRTYAADYPDEPERVLQATNRRFLMDVDAGMFVTLFYGVLEPSAGLLTYCNAGHMPPLIFSPGDDSVKHLPRTGIPLGIEIDTQWQRSLVQIPPGGILLLYTDGITDAQNQSEEFFGEQRLLDNVRRQSLTRTSRTISDALISSVFEFASGQPQVDDITLMVLAREEGRT